VYEIDLFRNLGQIKRFFSSRVPAAHHDHGFVPVEEAVARGAVGNPFAAVLFLSRGIQLPVIASGCEDHGMRVQGFAVGQSYGMVIDARFNGCDLLLDHFKTVGLGMIQKLVAKFHAADVFKSRVVLYRVGHGNLSAVKSLFDQHGLECRSQSIDSCAESGRPSSHNNQVVYSLFLHL
jgi:hypothetical protein